MMKGLPTFKLISEILKRETQVTIKDFYVFSIWGSLFLSSIYYFLISSILVSLIPDVSRELGLLTIINSEIKIITLIKLLIFNFLVVIFGCYLFFSSYWISPKYFRLLTIIFPVIFLSFLLDFFPDFFDLQLYFVRTVDSIVSYEYVRDSFIKFIYSLTQFCIGLFLTSIILLLSGFFHFLIIYIIGNDKRIK